MAAPHSLGDTTRAHEIALFNWLGTLRVDYNTLGGRLQATKNDFPVLRVMATPERAASAIGHLLIRSGLITVTGSPTPEDYAKQVKENFDLLPLPFISVQETGLPSPDLELAGTPKTFQQFDAATGQWIEHRYPGTYYASYSITFWSRKRYSQVFFREWLMSQLGPLGMGPSEFLLTVTHPEPFNSQAQTVRFDSLSDLSDLEGDEPRILRTELALQVRMLHFYPATGNDSHYIDTVNWSMLYADDWDGVRFLADFANLIYNSTESGNLFMYRMLVAEIPTKWVKAGNAVVSQATLARTEKTREKSLTVELVDTTDEVDITSRHFVLGIGGNTQGGISFEYQSDAPIELVISQRDGTATSVLWTEVQTLILPASSTWVRVHRFFEISQTVLSITVRGTGVAAVAHLTHLDIRHLAEQLEIVPTSTTPGVDETTYTWAGLSRAPYLVCLRLIAGVGAATHTVTASSPSFIRAAEVQENQYSQLLLLEPDQDTLTVSVPDALTISEVVVVRYYNAFRGDSV